MANQRIKKMDITESVLSGLNKTQESQLLLASSSRLTGKSSKEDLWFHAGESLLMESSTTDSISRVSSKVSTIKKMPKLMVLRSTEELNTSLKILQYWLPPTSLTLKDSLILPSKSWWTTLLGLKFKNSSKKNSDLWMITGLSSMPVWESKTPTLLNWSSTSNPSSGPLLPPNHHPWRGCIFRESGGRMRLLILF